MKKTFLVGLGVMWGHFSMTGSAWAEKYVCDSFFLGQRVDVPALHVNHLEIDMESGPRGTDLISLVLQDGQIVTKLVTFHHRLVSSTRCSVGKTIFMDSIQLDSTLEASISIWSYHTGCGREAFEHNALTLELKLNEGFGLRLQCYPEIL